MIFNLNLQNPYINAYIAFISIIGIGIGIGIFGYIISRLVSISKSEPHKELRYECGNLPQGRARGWFIMQYFAYLIVFLTMEPIIILFFIYLPSSYKFFINSVILTFIIILSLVPSILFALKLAKNIDLWRI
ncbi:MAG: NADH-quinone oxidoreductase subunit A [Candidatus Methanomethylicia archaeon]